MSRYTYLRDPAAIYRRSFALMRAGSRPLALSRRSCVPLAVRLAHAAGDTAILDDLAWSRGAVAAGRRALAAGAPILVDSAMVAAGITARATAGRKRDHLHARRPHGRRTRRDAEDDALRRRGRAVAAASRRRRGRDRQRADRAVSPARNDRRRRAEAGAGARLSGRLCRRRRGEGGARRICGLAYIALPGGAAAARWPPPRSTRCAARPARMTAWLSRHRHRRGRRSPASAPAARALVETAEMLVGGARHLAMVPRGAAERLPWQQPVRRHDRRDRARGAAVASSCWRAATRCATASAPCSPAISRREEMTILPQPERLQPRRRAARLGARRLHDAVACTAARSIRCASILPPGARILILSEDGATPRAVARLLTEAGWGPSRLTVLEHLGGPREARHRRARPRLGRPTHRRSQHHRPRMPGRRPGHARCRVSPGCPTTPSSMTASSPSAKSAPRPWRRWRRCRARPCGMSAPGAARSRSNGCAPSESLRAVAIERDPARAAMIARNAAALGVPELQIVAGAAPRCPCRARRRRTRSLSAAASPRPICCRRCGRRCARAGGSSPTSSASEGERAVLDGQARYGGDLTRLAVSRAEPLGGTQRLAAAAAGDPARREQSPADDGDAGSPARWRPYALLGALCFALYLPGITTIPVLDRDEARFAQATRQMLETGDFPAHPLSGRGAQQEAGGHLLAAGRLRQRAQQSGSDCDLALSAAVADRRQPCGAADFRSRAGAAGGPAGPMPPRRVPR